MLERTQTQRPTSRQTATSAVLLVTGLLAGFSGLAIATSWLPRDPAAAGLGLNTISITEPHPQGAFQFGGGGDGLADAMQRFSGSSRFLWLGASQLNGINNYRPEQRNVAYRVFDALIKDGVATLTVSFPLASPQEHDVVLQHAIHKHQLSGLVIGAAFGDMRHPGLRTSVAQLLHDPDTRLHMEETEAGRRLVAQADSAGESSPVARPEASQSTMMEQSERKITGRLQSWFGMEDFRLNGRAWILLGLQEIRRTLESLRARYTRDLSLYRIPMQPQDYAANWQAWRHMLATAKMMGVPVLIYIAPRPSDFFPFDPDAYSAFKNDLAALAAEYGATIASIEAVVPVEMWGTVDIGFGFYARDPFHFTAEGHRLMAEALLPLIRRTLVTRTRP